MIDTRGTVKVMDFGIARLADTDTMTAEGEMLGTVAYMSPEQAAGRRVGPPSDVYSAGVLLYELLAGRNPVRGATAGETVGNILAGRIAPLETLRPDLPARALRRGGRGLQPERRRPAGRGRRGRGAAGAGRPPRRRPAAAPAAPAGAPRPPARRGRARRWRRPGRPSASAGLLTHLPAYPPAWTLPLVAISVGLWFVVPRVGPGLRPGRGRVPAVQRLERGRPGLPAGRRGRLRRLPPPAAVLRVAGRSPSCSCRWPARCSPLRGGGLRPPPRPPGRRLGGDRHLLRRGPERPGARGLRRLPGARPAGRAPHRGRQPGHAAGRRRSRRAEPALPAAGGPVGRPRAGAGRGPAPGPRSRRASGCGRSPSASSTPSAASCPIAVWGLPAGSHELLANVVVAAAASGAVLALVAPPARPEAVPAGDPIWDWARDEVTPA